MPAVGAANLAVEGQRKPVTILFTDIVGSTGHAERMDPEDWREVVSAAHRLVSDAVYRYEGKIAQLLGDGVLAFFGAPTTHEDDPLRAVKAALDLRDAVTEFAARIQATVPGFQLRIGINTGTVVVGPVGSDQHMEYLAVGDAVNLAARLQAAAAPGGILVSDETLRLVKPSVEVRPLGTIPIKGKSEPVSVYEVVGLQGTVSIPGPGADTRPLIGRASDLQRLRQTGAAVAEGLGRAVLILGEPGSGKSRLLSEWRRTGDLLYWVECRTQSHGQSIPHHLVLDLLRALAGVNLTAREPETNRALAALVRDLFGEEELEVYAFLGHLLSLQLTGPAMNVVRGLDPLTLRTQYQAALQRLVTEVAGRRPVALVFEDVQWADASSVDFLTRLVPMTRELPLLVCLTSRLEPDSPGWNLVTSCRNRLGAGVLEIELGPLSADESRSLAASCLGADSLPPLLDRLVLEKASGNPLFIEEVIGALRGSGALTVDESGRVSTADVAGVELPDTLQRLVLAHVDRLPEGVKLIMRVAAVLGRQFGVGWMEAVLEGIGQAEPRTGLLQRLGTLEGEGLLQLVATDPELTYLFRRAVVQEVAYESTLKADRRRLHLAAAEALERIYPLRVDELAATLGFHFQQGQDSRRGMQYLERAADGARQRYANGEAVKLYDAALACAAQLKSEAAGHGLRIGSLLERRGQVQLLSGRHQAARDSFLEAFRHYGEDRPLERARCRRGVGNAWMAPRRFVEALDEFAAAEGILGVPDDDRDPSWRREWIDLQMDRLWALYWNGDVDTMAALVERLQPEIEGYGSAAQRSMFYARRVSLSMRRDRFRISETTFRDAVLCRRTAESASRETGDLTALVLAEFVLAFARFHAEDWDDAEAGFEKALKLAERTGNQEQRVLTLGYLATLQRLKGDPDSVRQWVPRAQEAAEEAGMQVYVGLARANRAWLAGQEGDLAAAEVEAMAAQSLLTPRFPYFGLAAWPLISVFLGRGEVASAVEQARHLLHPSQRFLPDRITELMRGAIDAFESGDPEDAGTLLREARTLARE